MGCKTIPEQLAEALGKTTVKNTDTLPIVENNTLYRVTVGDLVTSLGFTGSLTSNNAGGATPVLTGTAPNYTVRGIVGGAGANVAVNASGVVEVSTQLKNAGNSSVGEALIPNPSASTIDLRRLSAGKGIELTTESNRIVISNTEIAVTNNTVIVSDLTDFPTSVSGVITLLDNTEYFIANNISTSNRFVLGSNTVISSGDVYTNTLTYTGTGTMFTLNNGRSGVKEIALACPNGTLFDGSAVTTGSFLARWILLTSVKNLGSLGHPVIGLYDWFIALHTGNGLSFGNVTNGRLKLSDITIGNTTNSSADIVDLGAGTFDEISINEAQVLSSVAGQSFLKGAAGSANLNSGTVAFIRNTVIEGDMDMLDTISLNDAGFSFSDNNKLADTNPIAQLYLSAPATTPVTVIGTPVVVSGAFTTDDAQLYDTNVNGRATYKGVRDKFVRIDTTVAFEPASGSNKDVFVQLSVNGVALTPTKIVRTGSAGSSSVVSVDWSTTLSTNDFVEVMVGNDTDTVDVLVNQLLIRLA